MSVKFIDSVIQSYESLHPNKQHQFKGAKISFDGSQILEEFEKAWDIILSIYQDTSLKEISFLEVGAYRGLWGVAFAEFCRLKNLNGTYTTITLIEHDSANSHLLRTIDWIRSKEVKANLINMDTSHICARQEVQACSSNGKFNIVFIDAGHKYHEIFQDIQTFYPLASDLAIFHDIRPMIKTTEVGVYEAIKDYGIQLDHQITTNNDLMGIGIKILK